MMKTTSIPRMAFLSLCVLVVSLCSIPISLGSTQVPQTQLSGDLFPKFIDPLPYFAGTRVDGTKELLITMQETQQKVMPSSFSYPAGFTSGTYVWAYKIQTKNKAGQIDATYGPFYPAFTIEAKRGVPTKVKYVNNLQQADGSPPFLQKYLTVDQTLHWANPAGLPMMDPSRMDPYSGPVPAVVHLHGGDVPSEFDGGPDAWFTPNGLKGLGYRTLYPTSQNAAVYQYPNNQEPATIWYHDHALGATRLNVYAGMAGFYWIRDWWDPVRNPNGIEWPNLPGGPADTTVVDNSDPAHPKTVKAELEFAIQDKMFDTNGQLFFPDIGDNPEHPFWLPEFFGDVVLVNGKPWPFLNVEPRRYRFHFLDGSNARFYNMRLENADSGKPGPAFWVIGSDGGFLDFPAKVDPADKTNPSFLLMAPGERYDIIIDFAKFAGQSLILKNSAAAPYPDGDPPDPLATDKIMLFRVGKKVSCGRDPSYNPACGWPLRPPMDRLDPDKVVVRRQLTLNEVQGEEGPLEILVNNTKWTGRREDGTPIPGSVANPQGDLMTELPKIGTTELWEIINLTMDAHPIHLHLVQYQEVNRQFFDPMAYGMEYAMAFPGGTIDPMTGQPFPAGMYIPAFGPPNAYNQPNADGAVGGNPAIGPFLQGAPIPPAPDEVGWKDTMIMRPGQVSRILVRLTGQNGKPFSFDATGNTKFAYDKNGKLAKGPGYVWHCHIVDHEDNEMMRPYLPVK